MSEPGSPQGERGATSAGRPEPATADPGRRPGPATAGLSEERAPGDSAVRVRFPPSPTGDLHVGNVRSALFNWAYARHTGGAFVLRIEDSDRARSTEASYRGVLDELRWLGLDWDEGPEVGGPYEPYRQSERLELYREVARKLWEAGYAYEAYSTDEEVRARRAARGDKTPGYDNGDRDLTAAQVAAFRAEGRRPVLRFRMPDEPIVFGDLIRGEVRFEPENVPDFVLLRADGFPLYPLVNPVDDAVMRITHVLRGEDLLASTPRQIPLHRALRSVGVVPADMPLPEFGHLPFVLGEGNQKLSKRKTPEASLAYLRADGYVPEGVLNYLALLGWSMGGDRELFSMEEMAAAFTLDKVSRNSARFDTKKLTVINGIKIRELPVEEFVTRLLPFLASAGLVSSPPSPAQLEIVRAAAPLVQERVAKLTEAADLLAFFLVDDADFAIDPAAMERAFGDGAAAVLDAAAAVLADLPSWTTEDVQEALQGALVDGLGLRPRVAYGPVRVAVTGRTVSPPLFESMELLGRERTLGRLRGARAGLG